MSLWRKLFGKSATTKQVMAFYLFNSNRIGEFVSDEYGTYAQGCFFESLHKVILPLGGWKKLTPLVGCHGDLFERDMFGKPTGITVLAEWIKKKSCVDIQLSVDFIDSLIVNVTNIGYIPYAIGVFPILESLHGEIHDALFSSNTIGYIGTISVEANPHLPFVNARLPSMYKAGLEGQDAIYVAIASILSLPTKMGIRADGQCFGWLISDAEIAALGLSKLVT